MHSHRARRDKASGLCYYPGVAAIMRTVLVCTLLAAPGCLFSEHSFPMDHADIVRADTPQNLSTRQWLVKAHEQLKDLLPHHRKPTLLTDELSDRAGRPVDLVARYDLKPDKLESLFVNFMGLSYSAQVTGAEAGDSMPPHWPGFIDVWTPISPELKLSGRLGMARDSEGNVISADCIVLLPGLCGGNNVIRQRDLAAALMSSGLHVLAVETRGQGQTGVRYPNMSSTWGIFESSDLLVVADWLEAMPKVKRTGLIGFSWGGVHATLTAWSESRRNNHPSVTPKLASVLPKLPPRRRYQAGMMVFSPVLNLEVLMEQLATPQSYLLHPFRAGVQRTVRTWKARSGFPNPTGQLHDVIRCKQLEYEGSHADHLRFLRLLPYKGKPSGDKFADISVPLLMIHGANDPIAPVQNLATIHAGLKNPNVATIVLPTGGHIGFAPYAKDWFYSLILSFFDPARGPKPVEITRPARP
ncbi:MAG: alpha/beta fold hydrolase [Phycisphaerae bacterium]|nr:alpha/beta fold hydrolase [Phycisphaerae bacterium]